MQEQPAHVLLDPGRALCWEDTDTLRIGFDRSDTRVVRPSAAAQRVITRLVTGIPEDEFEQLVAPGAPDLGGVREILNTLRPALVRRPPDSTAARLLTNHDSPTRHPSSIRAVMSDDGRENRWIHSILEANWLCNFVRSSAPPELAIQVIRFLEPLERTSRWLSAGIPHLLIRFTDEAARIGPLVSASGSPCHSCEALHLVDADPALPTLATQMHGRHAGSETPQTSLLVGAIATHFVHAWKHGATWIHDVQVCVPIHRGIASGIPSRVRLRTHPECGCALSAESLPL